MTAPRPCCLIAEDQALLARDVPVIIYSGQPKEGGAPPELGGLTWLEKPTDLAYLLAAMARLAPRLFDGDAQLRRTATRLDRDHALTQA